MNTVGLSINLHFSQESAEELLWGIFFSIFQITNSFYAWVSASLIEKYIYVDGIQLKTFRFINFASNRN